MSYRIIEETEYYVTDEKEPTIGVVMMLKNEQDKILSSLDSVRQYINTLIIYDTGSTDKTIEQIQQYSKQYKINLFLIQGEFVDFSTSRNVVLEYAEKVNVRFLLLLDASDELKGGEYLVAFCKFMMDKPNTGFLVLQKWWSGHYDSYYNIRFLRNRAKWRYFGSVHEWIKDTSVEGNDSKFQVIKLPDDIYLYQDRVKYGASSVKRFTRDKELLLNDYKNAKDKTHFTYSRTVFYLAQTCELLGDLEEALYYSKIRLELPGFDEEIFHSYMRCANVCLSLKHNWDEVMKWFMRAYEFSPRAEPLCRMAEHYKNIEKYHVAYMFIKQACELTYPDAILFVDKGVYDYYRWYLLSVICSFSLEKHDEGKNACITALKSGMNAELCQDVLNFYLKRESENKDNKDNKENKENKENNIKLSHSEFMKRTISELQQKYPKLPLKSIQNRAKKMWVNYNKDNKDNKDNTKRNG